MKKTEAASGKSNLNAPLTPNSIPSSKIPEKRKYSLSEEAKRITNPLQFSPGNAISRFLKLPGILIFCIFSGYLLGRYGFNFIFLFPIAHIAYYYFSRRVQQYSRTLEVMKREEQLKEVLGEFETVEWMNHIIKKFWDVSEQTVSSIIFNEVNNILTMHATKQGFSIRLGEITLGTRPPVVERISFLKNSDDSLVLEFATHFIPVQASDEVLSYFKKERTHWNTYIELQVIFANFVTIPILVKNFTFSGIFKVTLDLTQKIPFTKALSLSFLEMPVIDFQLVPLKTIDMLDLPYIGGLLSMIIESQIRNLLLQPNQLTVNLEDIAKYRGSVVGVIYVYCHDLKNDDQFTYWLTLKNNGKKFGISEKKSGIDPVFNQGFYDIIYDTTQFIEVSLFSTSTQPLFGKIHLRNLNKSIFNEGLQLSNHKVSKNLNFTTQFYPVTDSVTESAIVTLELVSIEDLQAIGDPVNKLYSSFCIVSLETREAIITRSVLKSTETKRIFATKNPFYNESFKFFIRHFDDYVVKIRIMNEKENKEIGKVIIPCMDIKNNLSVKYRISGVETGEINVKLNVKYIDMMDPVFTEEDIKPQPFVKIPEIIEPVPLQIAEKSKVESMLGGHIYEDPNDPSKQESENDLKIPSLTLGVYNRSPQSQRFIDYTKAYQFTINNIKAVGVFYLVFETDHLNIKMEPFSTDIPTTRSVVVPILNETHVKVRLFMFSSDGDTLISEEIMNLGEKVIVFDKIRIEFNVEVADLSPFNGEVDNDDTKILQVRISDFNRTGSFTVDFNYQEHVRNLKLVHHLNTFILGKENLTCHIKDNGKNVAQVTIPKRNCNEKFNFGGSLIAPLFCMAHTCSFKTPILCRKGELEVFILKVSNIKPVIGGSCDPYIKVFMNGEKIYKTDKKIRSLDPIFNESFKIRVDRSTDRIGFHLFSLNSLSIDTLVNFKDFPILNLPNGYSRFMIPLNDSTTGEITETEINVIFSFKPDIKSISK